MTKPQVIEDDFRRVLDDKEIDAVMIATPDHWHARMTILACQAGKDVYVEKPLCQTIREGQMMRDAARKHNRVVQVGTQRRSMEHFRSAVEFVASGKHRQGPADQGVDQPDPHRYRQAGGRNAAAGRELRPVAGPGAEASVQRESLPLHWRFFWDYGNSEIGNQGIHVLDVAIWAIQLMRGFDGAKCLPKRVSATGGIYWLDDAKEVPDTQIVSYDYGDMMLNFELRSFATDYLMPHAAATSRAEVRGRSGRFRHGVLRHGSHGAGAQRSLGGPLEGRQGRADEGDAAERTRRNFLECGEEPEKPQRGRGDRPVEHDAVPPGQRIV